MIFWELFLQCLLDLHPLSSHTPLQKWKFYEYRVRITHFGKEMQMCGLTERCWWGFSRKRICALGCHMHKPFLLLRKKGNSRNSIFALHIIDEIHTRKRLPLDGKNALCRNQQNYVNCNARCCLWMWFISTLGMRDNIQI